MWRSIGPALIVACVVFGPGSLLISSKVGATYGYEMLWLLLMTGVLMGTYMITAARIGIRTVDVGNPMLSMHSCREMAGTADVKPMIDVLRTFLEGQKRS